MFVLKSRNKPVAKKRDKVNLAVIESRINNVLFRAQRARSALIDEAPKALVRKNR
jgi:hypothetical protein